MPKGKNVQTLDEIDKRILRCLREDAHLTTQEIADRVGLSQTPCWSRIKRLEETGVIAGYVALLDPEKVGRPLSVIIEINLDQHDDEKIETFSRHLAQLPEHLANISEVSTWPVSAGAIGTVATRHSHPAFRNLRYIYTRITNY